MEKNTFPQFAVKGFPHPKVGGVCFPLSTSQARKRWFSPAGSYIHWSPQKPGTLRPPISQCRICKTNRISIAVTWPLWYCSGGNEQGLRFVPRVCVFFVFFTSVALLWLKLNGAVTLGGNRNNRKKQTFGKWHGSDECRRRICLLRCKVTASRGSA